MRSVNSYSIKKNKKNSPLDLSQNTLLNQLNSYLKYKNRLNDDGSPYQLQTGYCHGLTLLWLQKMLENKISWFYEVYKNIVYSDEALFDRMEIEIEKFLALIKWCQHTFKITSGNIGYDNIDQIMEAKAQKSFDDKYVLSKLNKALHELQGKNKMICVTSNGLTRHSIGIFADGINYHLYDANDEKGRAVQMRSSKKLAREVLHKLYANLGHVIPSEVDLEIKEVVANKNTLKSSKRSFE